MDGAGPDAAGPDAARDAATSARDAPSTDAALGQGPPYPIVLAHGFFGFEQFAGADFATYFHGVRADLAARGEIHVYTPAVDPFNDSMTRGLALRDHIESILAETGYAKVNLIGHSQGGLDARVVANLAPSRVASVTTIATPHGGSLVADLVLGLLPDERSGALVDALVRLIGRPLFDAAGDRTSVVTALGQFSADGIADFNEHFPDRAGVRYFSIAGRSDRHLGGDDCATVHALPFVLGLAGERDPIDPALTYTASLLAGDLGESFPNDGLVRARDGRWGEFWGCVPADHLDEIGQLFGDRPGLFNDFDHLDLFRALVAKLRAEGL